MTPDHPRYKWWMVLTVVPAGLISAIDGTSVGIAIPSMMTSLRADPTNQWVVTTYLLMQTLLMPMTGWSCVAGPHALLSSVSCSYACAVL
jgi:MFS family permease